MTTFSLCMIVKNESAVLRRCLLSIADLMDEIIIVDTGSTDTTKEIAAEFTDKIYDYTWCNDFADARNFAFSKANMDYIYSADADEVLDEYNRQRLAQLKETILPEIEIVQMYYITPPEFNTTANFLKEYRPKLYKRLRTFTWVDAIHETVRLEPVIYDSEIEIQHLPQTNHNRRDFSIFQQIFEKQGNLSTKLHSMYAKELLISGLEKDFLESEAVFAHSLQTPAASVDMQKEAICILSHIKRLQKETDTFFSLAFKLLPDAICAEICYEIGEYFFEKEDIDEAIQWYEMAVKVPAIIDVRRSGRLPLSALSKCYTKLAQTIQNKEPENVYWIESCLESAADYEAQAKEWEIPLK